MSVSMGLMVFFAGMSRVTPSDAVLKTLGFSRKQLRATVAWATTLAGVALGLGIPLGVIAGRWTWWAFAQGIAVVPAPIVPAWILLAIPAAILLGNVIEHCPGAAPPERVRQQSFELSRSVECAGGIRTPDP
jgi:predicted lysophospholipase L1 biosynthesis ABC-type transport system permease subunit